MRGKLLGSIKSLYKESKACVRVEGDLVKEFVVEQGLRQGCPLSPWLFNVFLDRVMREAIYGGISRRSGAGQLPHSNLSVYRRHSDDCPDRRRPTVSWNVGRFHEAVKRHGLMANWTKTNTMVGTH